MISLKENTIIKFIWAALIFSGFGIIVTLSIYIAYGHITLFNDFDDRKIESLGSFVGGFFGTILTIAATFLIWLTYNNQKNELEKTTQIAEIQSRTLITQQFESTFFNMSKMLAEIPQNVNGKLLFNKNKKEFLGLKFLEQSLINLIREFNSIKNWSELIEAELMSTTSKVYDDYAQEFLAPLDHYFRYFYNILKFIDKSQVENKKMYADLLQAQLSKTQLGLLFYNGIGRIGKVKLYRFLEKYNFLENLNPDSIFIKENRQTILYPFTTFKFLSPSKKGEIILNAIIINPDRIEKSLIKQYYIEKYNVTREIASALYQDFSNSQLNIYSKNIDPRLVESIINFIMEAT